MGEFAVVLLKARFAPLFRIVSPHAVAARALGEHADEILLHLVFAEQDGKGVAESSAHIGRDRRGAAIMKRVVAQNRKEFSVHPPDSQHREIDIGRTGRPGVIPAEIAGMHHGPDVTFTEGISADSVGSKDPAPTEIVFVILHHSPAGLRGLQIFVCLNDAFDNLAGQKL